MKLSVLLNSILLAVTCFAAPPGKQGLPGGVKISPLQGKPSTFKAQSHPGHKIAKPSSFNLNNITNTPVEASNNWSGAVQSPAPSGTFTYVQGIFNVPTNPTLPAGATPDIYYVSIWVGLDGWGNDILFQAGVTVATELFSDGATETIYWAWYEWYPELSQVITNFPVSPGDTIAIALTEDSPSVGTLLYENLSQGVGVQGNIGSPEASARLQGLSVEWIVEDPGVPQDPFLGFGTVVFQDCLAETTTGEQVTLADATLLSLYTLSGDTITDYFTEETLLDDTDLQVVYVGP